MKKYYATLTGKKRVAKDTIEVSFSRPDDFHFKAGQYIQLGVPQLLYPDPAGASRLLSIASSPLVQKDIRVAFRGTGSGFKRTFKDLPLGSSAVVEGPYGFFTIPERQSPPLVFIAGGIGITPYISMLRYATEQELDTPIILLYANTSRETAAYLKELETLEKLNNNITFKQIYGIIDGSSITDNVPQLYDCVWYVSGPPAMVNSVRNLLTLLGVEYDKICFEEFTGYL